MKKFLLILLFIVFMAQPCLAAALDPSIDNKKTYKNAYRFTGKPKDLFLDWCEAVEDAVNGTATVDQLLFAQSTSAPTATEGTLYYNATTEALFVRDSDSWNQLAAESGTVSLDTAYNNGNSIDVDGSAVTMTVSDGDNNVALAIVQNDATNDLDAMSVTSAADLGTAVGLQFACTAGFDVQGTSDSWSISIAGLFDGEGLTGLTNSQGILFDTNNEIQFGDNSEDVAMVFSANTLTWDTDTAVDSFAFGTVDDLEGVGTIVFDAVASTVTLTSDGDADDLTISVAGATNSSLILSSSGTGTDALQLNSSVADIDINSADNITIDAADDFTLTTAGGAVAINCTGSDMDIDCTDKSLILDSGEATTDAINIDAGAGGIDADTALSISFRSAEATGDAIELVTTNAAGGIDITSGTGDVVITSTDDIQLTNATAAGDMIQLLNTAGTSVTEDSGAIQLTATAGGVQIQSDAAIDGDTVVLRADGGATADIMIHNDAGTGVDCINLVADVGGIALDAGGVASSWTITADGAGDDLSLIQDGAADGSIVISSAGTATNAIDINATAGGIDIDISGAAATEDFSVTTDSSITMTTSEAVADQFKVDATGVVAGDAINLETTNGGVLINADGANGDIDLDGNASMTFTTAGNLTLAVTGNVIGNVAGDGSDTLKGYLVEVEIEAGAAEAILIADSGKVFTNTAAAGVCTYTLPGAAAGLIYIIHDGSATGGDDVHIDPQGDDTIDGDAAGDGLSNTADEASATITLVALDGTRWVTVSETGTWAAD